MIWIANFLVAVVAALHVYFLILEMFLWTRPLGLKTFRNSIEKATESAVLAANQGLYNGFLAAGLVWGLFHPNPAFAFQIKVFFLLCVIVAGVYGAATVSRRISLCAGGARGARVDPALAGVSVFAPVAGVASRRAAAHLFHRSPMLLLGIRNLIRRNTASRAALHCNMPSATIAAAMASVWPESPDKIIGSIKTHEEAAL